MRDAYNHRLRLVHSARCLEPVAQGKSVNSAALHVQLVGALADALCSFAFEELGFRERGARAFNLALMGVPPSEQLCGGRGQRAVTTITFSRHIKRHARTATNSVIWRIA